MTQNDLLRLFILDSVADDYENVAKIREDVKELGISAGVTASENEITDAIIDMVASGLIKPYRLSPTSNVQAVEGRLTREDVDHLYFWLTEKGRDLQLSDCPDWPFDATGSLRPDWQKPQG